MKAYDVLHINWCRFFSPPFVVRFHQDIPDAENIAPEKTPSFGLPKVKGSFSTIFFWVTCHFHRLLSTRMSSWKK